MPIVFDCIEARSNITEFTKLDNGLFAFSTIYHGASFLSAQNCQETLKIVHEQLNFNTKAVAFSPDAKHMAFSNGMYIYVIRVTTRELIKTIPTNKEDITLLAFDPTSQYILAGSASGRVLQYKYSASSLLSRLCSFPYDRSKTDKDFKHFVSVFAFNKHKLACSGFGGAIFILDLLSQANRDVLTHNEARIDAMSFLDDNTLITGNEDGIVQLISLKEKKLHKPIELPFKNIKQIVLMPENPSIAIVHSMKKTFAIIDIREYSVLYADYVRLDANVLKIEAPDSESIIIALQNSNIVTLKILSLKRLGTLLIKNHLKQAYELVEDEPLLKKSYEYKILEDKYESVYLSATDALIKGDEQLAIQLTDIFQDVKSKKKSIDLLFQAFDEYEKFKELVFYKKYTPAYAMSETYPALQHTPEYMDMERRWKKAFIAAQKFILQGEHDKAEALLHNFIGVAKKRPIIQPMLKENALFIEFLKALESKNFNNINDINSKHELFSKISNHISIDSGIQEIITKVKELIKSGDIKEALNSLEKIKGINNITQEVTQLYEECSHAKKLYIAYKKDNFILCYEIIDIYPHLIYTDLGILLEKHWSELMQKCETFALNGNLKGIKSTLGELIKIYTRRDKIGDLIRLSYHSKIKILINKSNFKSAEEVIYSYIDIFGLDNEIKYIMKIYETLSKTALAITENQNERPARDDWLKSKIIMG